MVRDSRSAPRRVDAPDPQSVLDALDDPDCRRIVRALDEPMTASEISNACDIPSSTTYRKLDRLTDASLLVEQTELRADGHHTTRYRVGFEAVAIELDGDHEFAVDIERPDQQPEDRLASLWTEVRKQT